MPAVLLTIALNTKQTQKAPLVIEQDATFEPKDKNSCRRKVVRAAETKLRLKRAKRIFVQKTGQELVTELDWLNNVANGVVLLVSKGEDYIGGGDGASGRHNSSAGNDTVEDRPNPHCPVKILAEKADVHPDAVKQLEAAARTLPGLIYAVGQPDLHVGNKYPIGSVFVSRGWIHPPLIGTDIGCGMAYFKVEGLRADQLTGDKGRRIAESLRGLEGTWESQTKRAAWLRNYKIESDKDGITPTIEFDKSLGTIGGGNHFAEIQVVEHAQKTSRLSLTDPSVQFTAGLTDLSEDAVLLLVHSGSRGYGEDVLKRYHKTGRDSCPAGSDEAKQYMFEHDMACRWANANRDLIALRILSCLEPGDKSWSIGGTPGPSPWTRDVNNEIGRAQAALHCRKLVDIHHNNIELSLWPPPVPKEKPTSSASLSELAARVEGREDASESRLSSDQEYVYIHRKGAAPVYDPKFGVPLVYIPLPGSRATPTLVVKPSFGERNQFGAANGLSLAHGAGRALSRTKALESLKAKYKGDSTALLKPNMKRETIKRKGDARNYECQGAWVVCESKDLVWEEAPEAYKDVVAVGEDLEEAGAGQIIAWASPRVCYKMRDEWTGTTRVPS